MDRGKLGECPFFTLLGDRHFGHLRFKIFLIFDFDGHLVDRHECLIAGNFLAHFIRHC